MSQTKLIDFSLFLIRGCVGYQQCLSDPHSLIHFSDKLPNTEGI